MIDFAQLQEIARENLERDRAVQSVKASGPTLELAVADAAALLNVPVFRVEYEILERGFPGVWGMGKKDWHIQAYERIVMAKRRHTEIGVEDDTEDKAPVIEDRDGRAFVFLQSGGDALLKVMPPQGNGKGASEIYVLQLLSDRKAVNVDKGLVSRTVSSAEGSYVKVGEFDHHSYNDSVVAVRIANEDMQAFITVSPPGEGGCDIPYEAYITTLKNNRVVHGIKEDFLRDFADQPIYKEDVEAAAGSKPVDGKSAFMEYRFETDQTKARLREGTDGKIDFKELNIIQNVFEKQLLAKKVPPQKGIPGETVTGKMLPAKNGNDISLPLGENVHASDDGDSILSDISGRVVIVNGKINVEPVLVVENNVSLETGNIIFLGTVIVKGDVEDGFSVKAAGNIEVHGSIERAELDAEGDIIIHQGINGKGGGNIRTGKSLWARFIQNANIQTGNMVFASDGIINSNIDALNRIICQGKRASIVGGRLRASEEINAKILGNPTSGTETICEVGYDPASKEEQFKLEQTKESIEKELDEIKINMQTLINIKQHKKVLPEDKQLYLEELIDRRDSLMEEQKENDEKIKQIKEHLGKLKTRGKVSASAKVFPGVKITIRDVREEVNTEYKAVTFVLEGGLIRVSKYEEPDKEAIKGPDGYSTN
ncbi:MAG: FapA family protein [Treponema sp.]|nr:FapA family protein [Treponema sp.]